MSNSQQRQQFKLIALAVLLASLVAVAGNFHFVYGSGVDLRKINKISWSLSETIVNLDEVRGTPALLIRAKYPLFSQALEQLD